MASRLPRIKRAVGWVWRRAAAKYPPLAATLMRLARLRVASFPGRGVDPARMVWIFGSGRSGSTWLRSMMGEMEGHLVWEEPLVGRLFGEFYDRAQPGQLGSTNFIMGEPKRSGWIRSIRNFVIDGANYRHPRIGPENYLIVKEPNGSAGAPLLMEALPESRMIFLLRDPRDVVASVLEGAKKGNWLYQWGERGSWKQDAAADNQPDKFAKIRADMYAQHVGNAARAYEAHRGPKALVRYEQLRADTLGTMRRLYKELAIPFEEERLRAAVDKHAWENIPKEEKGEGKFYRKASPGSWREDLSPRQVEIVEQITAPLLQKYYPA